MNIKVLIYAPNYRECNGVANVIMGQYKGLLENNCSVDFIQNNNVESIFTKRIYSNNGKLFTINSNKGFLKKIRYIKKIIKENKYDVIHINAGGIYSYFQILYAKKYNVKTIIWHSHNTKINYNLKNRIKNLLNYYLGIKKSNCYIACTNQAGKDVFKKNKFYILNNAIDVSKFLFSIENRKKIRQKYNISDNTFVVGTVCRYSMQKNPFFMIDIFKKIVLKRRNSIFLWVGSSFNNDDKITQKIKNYIKECNLENHVILCGSQEDTSVYYSAMDVFMMPSIWEGLGIVYVESQANSLPTYASNVVPDETNLTNMIKYISLKQKDFYWAEQMLKNPIRNGSFVNLIDDRCICEKNYDINYYYNYLYTIYENELQSCLRKIIIIREGDK